MWYFSWLLGLGLACAFAIINAMWYEVHSFDTASAAREPSPDDVA